MIALHHISRPLAFGLAVAVLPSLPVLAAAADPAADQVMLNTRDLKWVDAPPTLPKGAKVAVLSGDPSKAGPYAFRLKMPAGYKVPPHWHTQSESVTVISGTLYLGMGDELEAEYAHALKTGGFHTVPSKIHHFAYTKAPTVVQIHGEGPLDITYINPADDPQKSAAK